MTSQSKASLNSVAVASKGPSDEIIFRIDRNDQTVLSELTMHFTKTFQKSVTTLFDNNVVQLSVHNAQIGELARTNDLELKTGTHLGYVYFDCDKTIYVNCSTGGNKKIKDLSQACMSTFGFNVVTPICTLTSDPARVFTKYEGLNNDIINNFVRQEALKKIETWHQKKSHDPMITVYMNKDFKVFVRSECKTDAHDKIHEEIRQLFEGWNPEEPQSQHVAAISTVPSDVAVSATLQISDNDEAKLKTLLMDCLNKKNVPNFNFLVNAFQVEKHPGLPRCLALEWVALTHSSSPGLKSQFEFLINNSNNKSLIDLLRMFAKAC